MNKGDVIIYRITIYFPVVQNVSACASESSQHCSKELQECVNMNKMTGNKALLNLTVCLILQMVEEGSAVASNTKLGLVYLQK